jgi:hypothetical protein
MRPAHRSVLFAALLCAAACKRPEDQAAKQRIFSPDQPVGTDAKAKEPLDARKLADDPKTAERVLRMSRAEAATRLGSHKLTGRTQFAWTMGEAAPDAGPTGVGLTEDTALLQARGGDFQAKVENDHNQGFEAVWTGGEVFVRSRFGPFRKRRTDRSDPPRLREQTSASLATVDQLARGLKLQLTGETAVEGRRALRYDVAGTGARPQKAAQGDTPAIQWPEPAGAPKGTPPGPDPDTARRLSLWEKEQPVEVDGSITVDAETAVPLAYDLQGTFRVAQQKGPPAELAVRATLKTTGIGKDVAIQEPAYEPEPSVPHAVKDPLRFLGKQAPSGEAPAADEGEEEAAPEEPPAATPAPSTPAPSAPKNGKPGNNR